METPASSIFRLGNRKKIRKANFGERGEGGVLWPDDTPDRCDEVGSDDKLLCEALMSVGGILALLPSGSC